MIYLASPYAAVDYPALCLERYQKACAVRDYFLRKGISCYSPIAHNHNSRNMPEDGWGFWYKFDLDMLVRCDILVVLKLDRWEHSTGIQGEMEFARSHGMPILFLEEENVTAGWEGYA
jgi:Domain of unknown function (DUF1937)